MSAERWKQVIMSACFAVLVLALGAVWVCIVTDHPLKKSRPYQVLVEAGRRYENLIGWQIVDPSKHVARLADGNLTFAFPHDDQQERIASVARLADFSAAQGARLIFVLAPFKVDAFGDEAVNGRLDFSKQNADELLAGLRQHGIEVVDLREDFHAAAPTSEAYHRFFYRTDHRWRPQAALFAADLLAQRLEKEGIPMDRTAYDPTRYALRTLPAIFLGSQGKKVTLASAEPEDFDLFTPDFPVKLHVEIPSLHIDATGGFELLLDPHQVERADYYNLDPYAFYGRGEVPLLRIENLDQPDQGKKLLLIRDSFSDTLAPYLALGCRQLTALNPRLYTDSIEPFIQKEKPDVVVVIYTMDYFLARKIIWDEHKDKFDFR